MPIFDMDMLDKFPPASYATEEGVIGIGGELSPEKLIEAYSNGIFPWYNQGDPIIWWSPDPRMVLYPGELKVHRSLRNILNRQLFQVTFDEAFLEVIKGCRDVYRPGQHGTWITSEMLEAYHRLHQLGYAHSVEVWQNGVLEGGLYGVALGKVFFGESMFTKVGNASKVGFVTLVQYLQQQGFGLIDCQTETRHLASLGARKVPRHIFLKAVNEGVLGDAVPGPWGSGQK